MSSGDWICGSCQHMNFKKRDSCQRCGYSKFGGGDVSSFRLNRTEVLPGDWYCNVINCGAHNYASRPNCHKCGETKNDYCNVYGGSVVASAGGALPDGKPVTGFALGLDAVHTTTLAGWSVTNVELHEISG